MTEKPSSAQFESLSRIGRWRAVKRWPGRVSSSSAQMFSLEQAFQTNTTAEMTRLNNIRRDKTIGVSPQATGERYRAAKPGAGPGDRCGINLFRYAARPFSVRATARRDCHKPSGICSD